MVDANFKSNKILFRVYTYFTLEMYNNPCKACFHEYIIKVPGEFSNAVLIDPKPTDTRERMIKLKNVNLNRNIIKSTLNKCH